MPNGLLLVLEEELQWPHTNSMMLNSSMLMLGQEGDAYLFLNPHFYR